MHASLSSQTLGLPLQPPPLHVSPTVHGFPSSQLPEMPMVTHPLTLQAPVSQGVLPQTVGAPKPLPPLRQGKYLFPEHAPRTHTSVWHAWSAPQNCASEQSLLSKHSTHLPVDLLHTDGQSLLETQVMDALHTWPTHASFAPQSLAELQSTQTPALTKQTCFRLLHATSDLHTVCATHCPPKHRLPLAHWRSLTQATQTWVLLSHKLAMHSEFLVHGLPMLVPLTSGPLSGPVSIPASTAASGPASAGGVSTC